MADAHDLVRDSLVPTAGYVLLESSAIANDHLQKEASVKTSHGAIIREAPTPNENGHFPQDADNIEQLDVRKSLAGLCLPVEDLKYWEQNEELLKKGTVGEVLVSQIISDKTNRSYGQMACLLF